MNSFTTTATTYSAPLIELFTIADISAHHERRDRYHTWHNANPDHDELVAVFTLLREHKVLAIDLMIANLMTAILVVAEAQMVANLSAAISTAGIAANKVVVEASLTADEAETRAALQAVHAVWKKWMALANRKHQDTDFSDFYALDVSLGTYAANRIEGDPVWLLLISGSGDGKTEAVTSMSGQPDVKVRSSISGPPALLSATPKKEKAKNATGGLLREIGESGVIVLKDFTTILSMHREARAEVIAALREVYDGRYTRSVGSEGGQTLEWTGKCGLIAASTTAVDSMHQVLSTMGTRFLTARVPETNRSEQGHRAVKQSGKERLFHRELSTAVSTLFSTGLAEPPPPLDEDNPDEKAVIDFIVLAAELTALARSPVERDARGEIELVEDPEAPTRLSKELAQLYRGLLWIGLTRIEALDIVGRVALDTIPKLRRKVIEALADLDESASPSTRQVSQRVDHPSTTTERALEDLLAHGVVRDRSSDRDRATHKWALQPWARTAVHITRNVGRHLRSGSSLIDLVPSPTYTEYITYDKTGDEEVEAEGPEMVSDEI